MLRRYGMLKLSALFFNLSQFVNHKTVIAKFGNKTRSYHALLLYYSKTAGMHGHETFILEIRLHITDQFQF